jgi:hypothetical protein
MAIKSAGGLRVWQELRASLRSYRVAPAASSAWAASNWFSMLAFSLNTQLPSPLSGPGNSHLSAIVSTPVIAFTPCLVDKNSLETPILSNSKGGGGYPGNLQQFRDLICGLGCFCVVCLLQALRSDRFVFVGWVGFCLQLGFEAGSEQFERRASALGFNLASISFLGLHINVCFSCQNGACSGAAHR